MRRLIAVAVGLFVALSVTTPAQAATQVDVIVGALHKAPVYVAQGTPGTTSETAASLTGKLFENDTIVLVMLPDNASPDQEDVNTLAQKIDKGLKGKRIVGIAVGAQFAGAASKMPSGIADDLMNRAASVSTNPAETLGTFVRNVHDWQAANPEPAATSGAKASSGWLWWLFLAPAFILLLVYLLIRLLSNRLRIKPKVRYTAPGTLNELVRTLMRQRNELHERDPMREAINLTCRYTEAYFKRFAGERSASDAIVRFGNQLNLATKVVKDYSYAIENPEYIDEPDKVSRLGLDSINGLADTILKSIKKGNSELLLEFRANTSILEAQRYKNPDARY
jgi:hypothetical protein